MMIAVGNTDFSFRTPAVGYIKNTVAANKGPPVLMFWKHTIREGQVNEFLSAYQEFADYHYKNIPGARAILASRNSPGPKKKVATDNTLYHLWAFDDLNSFDQHVSYTGTFGVWQRMAMHVASHSEGDVWAGGAPGSREAANREAHVRAGIALGGKWAFYNSAHGFVDFTRQDYFPPRAKTCAGTNSVLKVSCNHLAHNVLKK